MQEAFDSYARYWLESFRLPYLTAAAVDRGMRVDGYRATSPTASRTGNGVILALPHLGGWEWAGRWLVDRGHGLTVVVERLDPPELFDWFADLRAKLGHEGRRRSGPSAGREVIAALRRNDIVCLLCDRDIQRNGVEVEFFGERTTLPAGPVTLALRTGAPILPTAVYFTDRTTGHLGLVRPPLPLVRTDEGLRADVARARKLLASRAEYLVRRPPSNGTCSNPTGRSTPATDARPGHRDY